MNPAAGAPSVARAVKTDLRTTPSLKDVARAAGVHVATASRALDDRRSTMVRPATLDRVRRAAVELGYRPNRMARGLKLNRSFTVGMLIPDITNPFFPPIVRGAEDCLAEAGYTLILANTDNDEAKERRHVTVMLERQVDGLLLATARRQDPLIEELRDAPAALVLVNRTIDRGGITAVIPDDVAGMTFAVHHLYRLGHRRIGHVGGPVDTSTGARRAIGFSAATAALRVENAPVVHAAAFAEPAGRDATRTLLADVSGVTAIVAGNDLIALGAITAAAETGRRCPRDVAVIGFNDMPFVGRFDPPLTTVRVPEYEIGRRAARLLLERIDRPSKEAETVLVAPELVVRGSTSRPA